MTIRNRQIPSASAIHTLNAWAISGNDQATTLPGTRFLLWVRGLAPCRLTSLLMRFGIAGLAFMFMTILLFRTIVGAFMPYSADTGSPLRNLSVATATRATAKTSRLPSRGLERRFAFDGESTERDAAQIAAMLRKRRQLGAALLESDGIRDGEEEHKSSRIPEALIQTVAINTVQQSDKFAPIADTVLNIMDLPVPVPRPDHSALIVMAIPIPRLRTGERYGARANPLISTVPATATRGVSVENGIATAPKIAVPEKRTLPDGLLGYAKADDEGGTISPAVKALNQALNTAVYDIEAGAVYLPNGETLEAHSGIGAMRDNPAFVSQRNHGPTPPHIYDLSLREAPFHGVEAIRLTPVDGEKAVFGRDGLLAHSYLHGKNGDSNGCVVFKKYQRFLAAFKQGLIKRLIVVPRLGSQHVFPAIASILPKNS